jgi:preprotein translocase subunit SecG
MLASHHLVHKSTHTRHREEERAFRVCFVNSGGEHRYMVAILVAGMLVAVTLLHVVICLFLIIVVLLQSGKAADLAGAFGGMGSQTVFGPRGSATVLSRATTVAASLFMITALTLVILANNQSPTSGSVLENRRKATPAQTPKSVTPVKPAAPGSKKQ